jgi:amino acid adenylation domain-containing protein
MTNTLYHLFQECAVKHSEAVAVEYQGRTISYGELNRRANRLAHFLRNSYGIRQDDLVAILVRDPPSAVIAIIAVLKAGGAYLPLDPGDPPGATRRILDDASPRALMIESSTASHAVFFGGPIFVMGVMEATLDNPQHDLEPLSRGSDLAYVIYTSGTTGAPKGIAIEHRSIVNTVSWRNSYYGLNATDVNLAIPRPSFDSSVEDTFSTLTTGGRLILPERDLLTEPRYVSDIVGRRAVTRFIVTPALYLRILEELEAHSAATMRSVTVAGEWFTSKLVQLHFRRLPDAQLFNEYGPAENSVCSTVHPLSVEDPQVLIGKPIDNTEAFVVDEEGFLVQPGESGELYLAGVGLARGYLGNPELSASSFLVPSSPAFGGKRVYKTGDIVRVHEDGNLQFVGRRDGQVKIRGKRVELTGIAEALARDEAVNQVHVLHVQAESATPRLIAFIASASAVDVGRLGEMVKSTFPEHMVPTEIFSVDSLPITGNGKVDEQALRALYVDRPAANAVPSSPAESALLAIWQRIFSPVSVGLDEDFFDLGGDSISVMDLLLGVQEKFGHQLAITDVYETRTVRRLACFITDSQKSGEHTS